MIWIITEKDKGEVVRIDSSFGYCEDIEKVKAICALAYEEDWIDLEDFITIKKKEE